MASPLRSSQSTTTSGLSSPFSMAAEDGNRPLPPDVLHRFDYSFAVQDPPNPDHLLTTPPTSANHLK